MTARRSPLLARASSSIAVVLASALTAPAFAQPAPAPAASGAASAKASLAAADKAAKAKDWNGALAGYTAANTAQPSAAALDGIAIAHYELKHAGEAYEAYDQFLKQYANALGATKKKTAETRLKELAAQTGNVSIRVNEAGAAVTLDGNNIGTSPVAALIRVGTGPHKIGVTKEGFAPVEKAATVAPNGKEIVEIALQREAKTGHLVVKEKAGAAVRVVVDGNDVGAAPLETDLEPGPHEIIVRSSTLAAPAQKVEIIKGKTSEIEVVAVPATAHLEVTTSDRQGIIFVDGKPVAEGTYAADVAVGPHTIAVTREGFERFEKTVTLADKQTVAETVTLKRPQNTEPTATIDDDRGFNGIYGGLGVLGLFEPGGNGNELETRCSSLGAASCDTGSPIGIGMFGFMGYAWNPLGIELFLAGMYDQATPSAKFDGVTKPGENPLATSVPRTEQFYFGRAGGVAALRARVSANTRKLRFSFAAGFGLAVKQMLFERDAQTPDGLRNAYVQKSGLSYVSPALSLDGSVGFRVSGSFAILVGVMGLLETAGQDVTSPASKNEYIGGQGQAYPIPTPSYHLASDTQVFIGPYVGVAFGP